ncbi:MAG: helix-turn-helix domain-containing protein [Clostridia bacterium]|nr:helix-turn-helix domain-containing protein [Clostridia bacterium]
MRKAVFTNEELLARSAATALSSPLHKHEMAEVHLLICGTKTMRVGDTTFLLRAGDLLAIPPHTYHELLETCSDQLLQVVFSVDLPLEQTTRLHVPPSLVKLFQDEIQTALKSRDFHKLSHYFSLLCCDLFPHPLAAEKESDYAYLIRHFFDNHYYKDVYLSDLAQLLHVSEKQAERLVVKYTGNKFRQELTRHRMLIAGHLMEQKQVPLSEIAHYVGYRSYSGFWKAWKKFHQEQA